ncbi:metallophosphoesterase [Solirubrobacter sp. CPCC 204708]|uniref:Metallophosphoesterase n=1 Tax=Solirubrobacter deserti TaxID=2282478 RepID=A0ABT4RNI1_9ACTN|nr:metallophosphoesterase [Solirubrobacter deserti]MBE2320146.1 metallophosphoesterase [Solirubrobacter deserti]MDA0139866.1 metallophosphoesterase [Solirubrobacter deserti]
MPHLIAQLSDPHLRLDDEASVRGLERAAARVAALNPAAVLLTGDIADTGAPEEYEAAVRALAPIQAPVYRTAGNHDRFEERQQYVAEVEPVRLVVCDTSVPGRDDGSLDVDWIESQLEPGTPTIIAMHHPPVAMGLAWLDEIALPREQTEALAGLLRRNPQVVRVVAGHVHLAATATLGGCSVVTCAGTHIQAVSDFDATGMVTSREEPPSVLVHAFLDDGAVITHVVPVTPA